MTFVLDAYAARSCPLKTVNGFTPGLEPPVAEIAPPPFFRDSDAIEAQVYARLLESRGVLDLRPLRSGPIGEAERGTLEAMASGADVIIGGMLPRDQDAHRSGRPSLLVRAEGDALAYHPVALKFHRVLKSQSPEEPPLVASTLGDPRTPLEVPGRRFRWGSRLNAALQVAHYWRLLEATGYAASHPWAGLIGIDQLNVAPAGVPARIEQLIAWIDLAAPCVPPNPRTVELPAQAPPISTLERYDHEHAHRVRLAERALDGDRTGEPLPVITPECRACVWQDVCRPRLPEDDLSVVITKSPLDDHEVRTLRRMGLGTVPALASADIDALLVDYLPRTEHRPGSEERVRKAHRRARMLDAGVLLERQTTGRITLAEHELEIDIDIETSADDRVYLWGFSVDDRASGRRWTHQVAAFDDLDATAEADLAREAFMWLRDLAGDRDAAVYHYSDYEVVRIGRLAPHAGEVGAWVQQWAAEHFVDLFGVVRQHFFGANGLGLKVVTAAVTDFAWRDEEPGGLASQSWFDEAVHAPDATTREAARVRVLEYNEDDVLATWHLRRWLREHPE